MTETCEYSISLRQRAEAYEYSTSSRQRAGAREYSRSSRQRAEAPSSEQEHWPENGSQMSSRALEGKNLY